jgi:hypothetical protein
MSGAATVSAAAAPSENIAGQTGAVQTIDNVRDAVRSLVTRYNAAWLIEKNGHHSLNATRSVWYERTLSRAA